MPMVNHTARRSRSRDVGKLASLTLISGVLSACHAPPMQQLEVAPEARAVLDSSSGATLENLEKVEGLLTAFETMRQAAVEQYGYLLLIPGVSRRYEQAILHHRQLCLDVCDRKARLVCGVTGPDLVAIDTWCETQRSALQSLRDTVDYVEQHGYVPSGWKPPLGFEYLASSSR